MSSFFTTPASQRKRKRSDGPSPALKKRNTTSAPSQAKSAPRARKDRSESISGSESDDFEGIHNDADDLLPSESEDSAGEDETAAEKRLRLAERYLANIRSEVEDDSVGFDARDIDRDIIAERLIEDVAENKGKIYRYLAKELDWEAATHTFFRADQNVVTGIAAAAPYVYTVGKDLSLVKWEVATPAHVLEGQGDGEIRPTNITLRKRPKRVAFAKGKKSKAKDPSYLGHTAPILSIAVSSSGTYLATGDANARLIIWKAETLTPLKVFTQHRAAINSLSFRRGTHQLFSASSDRTIKIWSADTLAYVETLFGHQDVVVGVAGGVEGNGGQEVCVSVGARDRTARLWKVLEESQLVFRGGGTARQKGLDKIRIHHYEDEKSVAKKRGVNGTGPAEHDDDFVAYAEGSIDCVALLDSTIFVTGSDNGALSLWSTHKKKPLFTLPLAHGRDPPIPAEEMSADLDPADHREGPKLPRWITALATVPFADLILSASWDGWIRCWRVGPEKRTIEEVGVIGRIPPIEVKGGGAEDSDDNSEERLQVRGIVNDLSVFERGDRGKDGLCVVAAVGKEHRLARWTTFKNGRNGAVIFEVPRKGVIQNGSANVEDAE
ncbi:small nucleolar ribonucleoprotein complex subunit [Mytilinidion resinicola]|uniref:Small nucleolar ribonucleoprotein complex subunit n=1 Tax=Mytilinidion resinicola TaxID=574789 RepID=A0A6A6Z488_9PEZI|nr:small nucleolar ribonucleoprotein complex subunit [Mytilinidion resinicola]KAF2815850.1 small nucleolar ribonucleoprotein complex subunit [Mytilinidion resinicola]